MPKQISELDYLVPTAMQNIIKVGCLVFIPFRNKIIFGLVTELNKDIEEKVKGKIKTIEQIIWETPALNDRQLNFVKEISEFYNTPLGFILQSCLLPLKKTKLKKMELTDKLSDETIVRKKPELKLYKDKIEKEKIFKEIISNEGQTLILIPEVSALFSFENISPDTVIINSELGEKQLFDIWVKIRSGKIKTVIGTRRALFMPWSDLRVVIVDDEANPNHKSWDMAPRVHTREAAMMLAHAHGAKCFITAHTPSVESWYFSKNGIYTYRDKLPTFENKTTQIMDMRNERHGHNYGFLSWQLEETILKNEPGDIFLFLNRKGSNAYVGCRDCSFVSKCEKCGRGLVYHENTSTLQCHFCSLKSPMNLVCPKCKGSNMIMYGVGTQLAEKELLKINNGHKKIIRLDADSANSYDNTNTDKIIIGTQIAWDKINWEKIKLMAFIDADSSLFIPEYKISENLWWQIRDAQYRLPPDARLILQTGHVEHQIFTNLITPEKFYEQELKERKLFSYPPFNYLIRLYNGKKTVDLSAQAADDLYRHLSTLTKSRSDIRISRPMPFSPLYTNGQYWHGLVIKASYEKYKQITKLIAQNTPENWKFDPNPNNLLSF